MPLLIFPTELLLLIFSFLGSQFFSHSLQYLTISKRWCEVALEILHQNISVDKRSLAILLGSSLAVERMKRNLKSLEIRQVFDLIELPKRLDLYPGVQLPTLVRPPPLQEALASSTKLASIVKNIQTLRSLSFLAKPLCEMNTMKILLSNCHLTELIIDCGSELGGDRKFKEEKCNYHICCHINGLFPTLRKFHCRLGHICLALLDLRRYDQLPLLEELVINIRSVEMSLVWPHLENVPYCGHDEEGVLLREWEDLLGGQWDFVPSLQDLLRKQMRLMAPRMPNAHMLRIIYYTNSCEPGMYDVLTGGQMALKDDAQWNAPGEACTWELEEIGDIAESESDEAAGESVDEAEDEGTSENVVVDDKQ